MKKTYENPMLQIVSVKNNDIVCTSPGQLNNTNPGWATLAPGERGLNDYYEGY